MSKVECKTTKKDFEIFRKEVQKWVGHFGLFEWKVILCHENNERLGECLAWCVGNYTGRVGTIGLSVDWKDNEVDARRVKKCAFHEVCELMLYPLYVQAQDRAWDKDLWEAESHAVIRRLENTVWSCTQNKGG